MKFSIDQAMFGKYPGLVVGTIIAHNIDNTKDSSEVMRLISNEQERIRKEFAGQVLSQHPRIAIWRSAYSAFGAKPKDHRSSVENLYQMVLADKEMRSINPLVDCYNLVSLEHMVPVGGEDLGKVEGDVVLTLAGVSEPTVLLLGDKEPRAPHPGEVIYKDSISAICRRWNWREADRTKLTNQTTSAILVVEGLPPITAAEVEQAITRLSGLIKQYCGATIQEFTLDEGNREISF